MVLCKAGLIPVVCFSYTYLNIYIKGRHTEGGRTEAHTELPSTVRTPNGYSSQGWARLNPEARNTNHVGVMDPSTRVIFCFLHTLAGVLFGSRIDRTQISALIWNAGCRWRFNSCGTVPAHGICLWHNLCLRTGKVCSLCSNFSTSKESTSLQTQQVRFAPPMVAGVIAVLWLKCGHSGAELVSWTKHSVCESCLTDWPRLLYGHFRALSNQAFS